MTKHPIAITAVLALAGCAAQTPAPQAAGEDINLGIAKTCTATPIDLTTNATANASITMTNDGWCAVHTKDKNGQPFQLGLVRARPQFGRVLIQKIGGETRIEYTPENRHVGADRFTVALRSSVPNAPDAMVQITVEASMGEGMAPAPAPAPATPARRAAPARARH